MVLPSPVTGGKLEPDGKGLVWALAGLLIVVTGLGKGGGPRARHGVRWLGVFGGVCSLIYL